jgi:2-polyprenyl-3-methyl-5-hydroxy-6-metoxy-1,4-benzoquinol methylase
MIPRRARALIDRRPDAAGRDALALFRSESRGARIHTAIRWYSCPFPQIARVLPTQGRILEIGCGHGLFTAYAALAEPGRSMVGTDIDEAKIAHARTALASLGSRVHVEVAEDGAIPPGPWDAVVIVDVLYLLPADAQRELLGDAAAALAPGGALIVKEMAAAPRWKARWNVFQETLAVKVLRITEGGRMTFVPPATMAGWLGDSGLHTEAIPMDRGRLHPHHVLVGRRSA